MSRNDSRDIKDEFVGYGLESRIGINAFDRSALANHSEARLHYLIINHPVLDLAREVSDTLQGRIGLRMLRMRLFLDMTNWAKNKYRIHFTILIIRLVILI